MKSECLNFLKSKHLYHLECFFLHNHAAPFPASSASAVTAWRVRNLVKFIAASPSGGSSRSARRRTSPACPTTWRCSTASYRLGNQLFSNTTCAWAHFTSFVFLQNRSLFYLSLMFIRVHKSESIDPCRLAGLDILKQAHVTMLVCIPLIFLQHGGGCK